MNCLNCGKQNPPSRSNRKRKYCSKQCANTYLGELEKQKHPRYNDPTWKKSAEFKKAARIRKNKEKLEHAQKHYISKEEAAKKLGIGAAAIWCRAKKNNIKSIIVVGRAFYKPEDIDKLQLMPTLPLPPPNIPAPEGYVTADGAAAYLGIKYQSFFTMGHIRGRKRPDPTMVRNTGVNTKRNLYSYEDLDKWIAEGERLKQERVLLSQQKRLEKEAKTKQRQQDIYNKTIGAGLIDVKAAKELLGYKSININVPSIKINGRRKRWFKPADLQVYKKGREARRLKRKNKVRTYALRKDDWMSDEAYEKRRKQLARCKPAKYILSDPRSMDIWNVHTEPWRLEEEEGIITQLSCNTCEETLPYTRFSIDIKCSSQKRFGRHRNCKACCKKKWKRNKQANSNKKTRNKFATQFINSIIRSLTKRNKAYVAIPQRMVWKQIKDYLGYTKEDFLNHIESQFKPWMAWENNGRPKDVSSPTWQLDHIKPKSRFKYTSIADLEFIECWSLDNLKPIEARINVVKSNKDLKQVFNSTFIQGIKSKNIFEKGIWYYLPYSNLDARSHLESQFESDISWDNHGTVWHVDHIIPQAYLSYADPSDDNFLSCWSLTNLQPLKVHENCAKGSRYNNKLWLYNYE